MENAAFFIFFVRANVTIFIIFSYFQKSGSSKTSSGTKLKERDNDVMFKCDAICENLHYKGINDVILDQLFSYVFYRLKLLMERQKCSLQMLMRDKYRRPSSDAAHSARRLTRAYNICPSIRQAFADDVTNVQQKFCKV